MGWWSLIAATLAQVVIGFLWYGPLFGKTWMNLSGIKRPSKIDSKVKKRMFSSYAVSLVFSFIAAYVIKIILIKFQFASLGGVAFVMFIMWLGFNVPVLLGSMLWEGKSSKLFALNTLYYLVSYIVMAWILLLNF